MNVVRNNTAHFRQGISALFIFVCVVGMLYSTQHVSALGISPATVILERLRQNQDQESVIYISRGNPSKDIYAQVGISGPAAPYISLQKTTDILLPKGKNTIPIPFTVHTGNLAAGEYRATIVIVTSESSSLGGGSGSSVSAGVQGEIRFSVTTESIEDYTIGNLFAFEAEEGQPIGFRYKFFNNGNVDARPSLIKVSITDGTSGERVYSETISGQNIKPIKAFVTQEVDVGLGAKLKVGKYALSASFYKEDKVIYEAGSSFEVFPPGTLAQKGELESLTIEKNQFEENEPVKIIAVFKNSGTVALFGSLVLEVLEGDKRVDVIKSEPAFIATNESLTFEQFYTPPKEGSYRLKAYVTFGAHKSNEREISFSVGQLNPLILWSVIIGLSLLIVVISVFFFRRNLKKTIKPQTNPPTPTSASPPSV